MKKNASELTEQATERARYFMDGLSLDDDGEKDGLQEESEYLQILIQHEEKRVQEEEERRLEERAEELLQEKEEVMRKAAEDRRQLEKGIVEKYKNEQKQIQERAAKRQRKICMDLKDSGLTPDQLNAVLAKLAIMDNAADDPSNPGQGPPAFPPKKDPHEATPVKSYGKNGQIHPVTIHRRGRWQWRKKLPW